MTVRIITGKRACAHCAGPILRRGTAVQFCSRACYGGSMAGKPKPPEQVAARAVPSGEAHSRWAGDAISEKGGRKRALKLFPSIGPCARCSAAKAERHHKDGDTSNNVPTNIEALCRRCHMEEDGRLASVLERPGKGSECR